MEEQEIIQKWPRNLSPCASRRSNGTSSSPEFEFWMVRNPSFPQPDLHSADELFSHGIILPLHQLHHYPNDQNTPPPPTTTQEDEPPPPPPPPPPEAELGREISSASSFTSSKRWRDLFKKSDKKSSEIGEVVNIISKEKGKVKEKKKEKKSSINVTSGMTGTELNINIWPFRRSRSAGNGGNRPRMAVMSRKVSSSAPCSRSNSSGDSKSRKWPSSPSRGGVHLGRSSPVWQVRRGGGGSIVGGRSSDAVSKIVEKGVRKDGNESRLKNNISGGATTASGGGGGVPKARVLNINVPMCIGYRHHLSCRSDENSPICMAAAAATAVATGGGGGSYQSGGASSSEGARTGNIFNIRSLFTKKVYEVISK